MIYKGDNILFKMKRKLCILLSVFKFANQRKFADIYLPGAMDGATPQIFPARGPAAQ